MQQIADWLEKLGLGQYAQRWDISRPIGRLEIASLQRSRRLQHPLSHWSRYQGYTVQIS
jgi:hypothetical protein